MPTTDRKLRVFLCHASQDKPVVRELYQRLLAEGWIDPWLDKENLLPGQDWDMEIEKAVEAADAVIVCLSNSAAKKEGYIQKELRVALNIALEKPEQTIFLIPLRLDECFVPRSIKSMQYIDYFPVDIKNSAYERLRRSLNIRFEQIVQRETEQKKKSEEEERRKRDVQEASVEKREKERQEREESGRIERENLLGHIKRLEDTKKKLENQLIARRETANKYREEIERIQSSLLEKQELTLKEKEEKERQIDEFRIKIQMEETTREEIAKKLLKEINRKKRIEDELKLEKIPYRKIITNGIVIGIISLPLSMIIISFNAILGDSVSPFLTGAITGYRLVKIIPDVPKALAIKICGWGGAISVIPWLLLLVMTSTAILSEHFTIQDVFILQIDSWISHLIIGIFGGWFSSYLFFRIRE